MPSRPSLPDLQTLLQLFYDSPDRLGAFEEVGGDRLPAVYRKLLDHNKHMTVTVESHHGTPVDVEVLESQTTESHYSRKILLRRQTDRAVVQFGIVRLCFDYLQEVVRREIEAQQTPLGRVLIQHNVLREVQLAELWRVACGQDLAEYFSVPVETVAYGRTALIYCNGEPAVELLEIVTPE